MTTTSPESPDVDAAGSADVTALRTAIETADRVLKHYQQGISLATDLKRTLVMRMIRAQFPRLSIDEEAKLLKQYGLDPLPKK